MATRLDSPRYCLGGFKAQESANIIEQGSFKVLSYLRTGPYFCTALESGPLSTVSILRELLSVYSPVPCPAV